MLAVDEATALSVKEMVLPLIQALDEEILASGLITEVETDLLGNTHLLKVPNMKSIPMSQILCCNCQYIETQVYGFKAGLIDAPPDPDYAAKAEDFMRSGNFTLA